MASYPPPTVLAQSLEGAGEQGEAPADLVVSTGLRIVDLLDLLDLLDRLERAYRPRTELIEDRYAVESLSADVPVLTKTADWLLGQISLQEAPSQQLRLSSSRTSPTTCATCDPTAHCWASPSPPSTHRAAHLTQAREAVRADSAAAHAGREQEAQQLQDRRGPDRTARATTAEDSTDYFTDPELLHPETS